MKILKINLANKLTMLRLLMVPVFIIVFNRYGISNAIPAIIFAVTAFTDFLDGYVARKYKMITTFGKFMDPLVDKVLTQAGYIVLTAAGLIPAWVVVVIIFRELLITGLRTIAASNNITIAASVYGKVKTITQFLAIIAYLLKGVLTWVPEIVFVTLLYISVFTTVISGLEYLYKNKEVLDLDNI